ncbi:MAG TPA: response regulator [Acetobacteraceae bacterium]|nr:response regulator [Acetobacteraceae bacterium]
MSNAPAPSPAPETVLVVESDVMVRLGLAEYLRHCGYRVIEAASADEAMAVLTAVPEISVDVVFTALELQGPSDGFGLSKWVRRERPGLEVVLAGSIVKAAHEAGELCDEGPHLKRPYEPEQVVEWIKRLRNLRTQA